MTNKQIISGWINDEILDHDDEFDVDECIRITKEYKNKEIYVTLIFDEKERIIKDFEIHQITFKEVKADIKKII